MGLVGGMVVFILVVISGGFPQTKLNGSILVRMLFPVVKLSCIVVVYQTILVKSEKYSCSVATLILVMPTVSICYKEEGD